MSISRPNSSSSSCAWTKSSQSAPSEQCTERTQTLSADPKPDPGSQLDQVNVILDTIRTNLGNVQRTWGRESRQFRDALEIMQSYLAENVERFKAAESKVERLAATGGAGGTMMDVDENQHGGWSEVLERGVEELMSELRI